ncbi:hypothetical protein IWX48DRAFT_203764 [Phyllosticta citricarpa]
MFFIDCSCRSTTHLSAHCRRLTSSCPSDCVRRLRVSVLDLACCPVTVHTRTRRTDRNQAGTPLSPPHVTSPVRICPFLPLTSCLSRICTAWAVCTCGPCTHLLFCLCPSACSRIWVGACMYMYLPIYLQHTLFRLVCVCDAGSVVLCSVLFVPLRLTSSSDCCRSIHPSIHRVGQRRTGQRRVGRCRMRRRTGWLAGVVLVCTCRDGNVDRRKDACFFKAEGRWLGALVFVCLSVCFAVCVVRMTVKRKGRADANNRLAR